MKRKNKNNIKNYKQKLVLLKFFFFMFVLLLFLYPICTYLIIIQFYDINWKITKSMKIINVYEFLILYSRIKIRAILLFFKQ